MADFTGTSGPDDLAVSGGDPTNRLIGLAGDDTLRGGAFRDRFFVGQGVDIASGGDRDDDYHYILRYESLYINEFESASTTLNRNDELILFTSPGHPDPAEDFGLEYVRDAFFQLADETTPLATPGRENLQGENAFIQTDTGVIEIFDQYGGEDNSDTQDGIEFISYRFTNRSGSTTQRRFEISSEFEVFTGTQTGDSSNEFFFGTRGADRIFGNSGDDLIFTGDGDDQVQGGNGVDHIVASRGNNLLDGGSSGDWYYWNRDYTAVNLVEESTGSSDDNLIASFRVDELGFARVDGAGPVRDLLLGYRVPNPGNAETSSFRFDGHFSQFNDFFGVEFLRFDGKWFRTQTDFARNGGAEGDFLVMPGDVGGRMAGRGGDDALFGSDLRERLIGGGGADFLSGEGGNDVLRGGAGDDTLRGGAGRDALVGNGGNDTADYRFSAAGVTIDLGRGIARGGDARGDRLQGIESVTGSAQVDALYGDGGRNTLFGLWGNDRLWGRGGSDTLDGGARNDRLWGGNGQDELFGAAGNDVLRGQAGNDTLVGERGDDTMIGGAGRDHFVVGGGSGSDLIRDFRDGLDRLVIDNGDTGVGPTGFADLTTRQEGADLLVTFEGGRVLLRNFDEDEFTQADVIFA